MNLKALLEKRRHQVCVLSRHLPCIGHEDRHQGDRRNRMHCQRTIER